MGNIVSYTANLINIKTRIGNLKKVQQITVALGYVALQDLIKKWNRGYGGDNRKMDELREPYKSSKGDTGRAAIPNMNYSGNLHSAMNVKMSGGTGAVIYAHGQKENEKLRGNEEIRANLLQLSKDKTLVTRLNKMVSAALKK